MTTHLNGWQRIGIVLVLLWGLFVCGYATYEYVERGSATTIFVEVAPEKAPVLDKDGRIVNYVEFRGGRPHPLVFRIVAALTVLPALAWAATYLCLYAVRWIIAGFKSDQS